MKTETMMPAFMAAAVMREEAEMFAREDAARPRMYAYYEMPGCPGRAPMVERYEGEKYEAPGRGGDKMCDP